MSEEKHSLRERLAKITDSPVQANTDEPQTEAGHRKKEEKLRIDHIKRHLSSITAIIPPEGTEAEAATEKVSGESPSVSGQSPHLDA